MHDWRKAQRVGAMVPLAEWWYNTTYHPALQLTPYEVIYGQPPPLTLLTPPLILLIWWRGLYSIEKQQFGLINTEVKENFQLGIGCLSSSNHIDNSQYALKFIINYLHIILVLQIIQKVRKVAYPDAQGLQNLSHFSCHLKK